MYSSNDYELSIITANLQSLITRGPGAGLGFLNLPALWHLDLGKSNTVHVFIERSRCALQHLAIAQWEESGLQEILKALPSLTSLTVDVQSEIYVFAKMLEKDPALLPQLDTLRIFAEHFKFDHLAFIQLLRERRAPSPFRTRLTFAQLDLYSEDKLSPSATIEFDKMIAQGLEKAREAPAKIGPENYFSRMFNNANETGWAATAGVFQVVGGLPKAAPIAALRGGKIVRHRLLRSQSGFSRLELAKSSGFLRLNLGIFWDQPLQELLGPCLEVQVIGEDDYNNSYLWPEGSRAHQCVVYPQPEVEFCFTDNLNYVPIVHAFHLGIIY
ncbi:hypothetical protein C8R47DRAFT_1065516 [Mycena vitilis]|nr:hypothetical protein C8R47DRAFT_1065516 [Mycena vitilis]